MTAAQTERLRAALHIIIAHLLMPPAPTAETPQGKDQAEAARHLGEPQNARELRVGDDQLC